MGHHGSPDFSQQDRKSQSDQFKEWKKKLENLPPNIGATLNFPDGKLMDEDKGELRFAVMVQDGRVLFHFGEKPITWIGFSKTEIIA